MSRKLCLGLKEIWIQVRDDDDLSLSQRSEHDPQPGGTQSAGVRMVRMGPTPQLLRRHPDDVCLVSAVRYAPSDLFEGFVAAVRE